jgi:riboflavin synthase
VRGQLVAGGSAPGDSIAVNGVCLTVVETHGDSFTVDVMKETFDRSAFGVLVPGEALNLERAATMSSRLGGHIVQGHVDAVGTVLSRTPGDRWEDVVVALPPGLSQYVVEKGSIAIDGVSLTVAAVDDAATGPVVTVSLIPTTLERTTLGRKRGGDLVNLEVDVIAKYVEKLVTGVRS